MATKASTKSKKSGTAKKKTEELDGLDLLLADHARIEQLFQKAESAPRDGTTRREVVAEIVRELSVHAVVEEQILYPLVRESLSDGPRLVVEALDEHLQAKEALATLERLSPADEAFETELGALIEDVRHHVREEEDEMFPELRRSVDRERLLAIRAGIEAAKRVAPTRPHPRVPDTPPANILIGLPVAVVDRARDAAGFMVKTGMSVTRTMMGMAFDAGRSVLRRVMPG